MKCLSVHVMIVWVLLGLGCSLTPRASDPELRGIIAQFHFAGLDQLQGSTNATALAQILALPETGQLRQEIVGKLAVALSGCFEPNTGGASANTSAAELIRPLLSDFLQNESCGEWMGRGKEAPVWTLAVRIPQDRAESSGAWRKNIAVLRENWRLKTEWAGYELSEFQTNSWLVVSLAPKASKGAAEASDLLGRIRSKGRPALLPPDRLLTLDADWSQLAKVCPQLPFRFLGDVKLGVSGRGNNLRTEGKFVFPTSRDWKLERWNVPTNTISDPQSSLISFTAVQGLGPWLARQPFIQDMKLTAPPNQLYLWGQAYTPYQIQAAAPVGNPTNFISQFAKRVVPRLNTNLYEHAVGQIQMGTDRLVWIGLPIIYPFLDLAADSGFVHTGILPVPKDTNPPPSELIRQLTGRTNLLYYDWEITQARIAQLRELSYLLSIFVTLPPMATNSAASKWLDAIEPKLGNTVTEISAVSPKEWTLVRTSPLGLNGIELLTFAHWLNSAHFPRSDFDIRFRPATPLPR